MPLRGGIRQQFAGDQPGDSSDSDGPARDADHGMRSYATGGRKRARTAGQFLTSLYLVGRLSAPELQEGASASISTAPARG